MSALTILWLCSAAAAVFVWLAGYLWGRAGAPRVERGAEDEHLDRERARAEAEAEARRHLERELAAAKERSALASRDLEAALAQVGTLQEALTQARALELERSPPSELDADVARRRRAELEQLRERLARAEARATEAEDDRRALQDARARLARAEARASDAEVTRQALQAAQAQLARLEASGRAADTSPPAIARPTGTLDAVVRAVAARSGSRSAVVADELGFPVVGVGEHQEPLAALCGVLREVCARAGSLLPLGHIDRVSLETDQGVTVSACSRDHEEVELTLATMTSGPGLATRELQAVLHHVSDTLVHGDAGAAEEMSS